MPVVELILPRQDLQSRLMLHLIILLAAVLVASTVASRMIRCNMSLDWRSCLGVYTPLMVR
jgi:hypothetical protein